MSKIETELLAYLIILALSLTIISCVFGQNYESGSNMWNFQNSCFLNFNQELNITGSQQPGVPVDRNLVSYWTMDEGAGSILHDVSGNANDGILPREMWTTGILRTGLNFNGLDTYVDCGKEIKLQLELTFIAWINVSSVPKSNNYIIGMHYGGPTWLGYALAIDSYRRLQFYTAASGWVTSTLVVPLNSWNFVCASFNGKNLELYLNDTSFTKSGLSSSDSSGASTYIGTDQSLTQKFNGVIDDVRIYNRTLSRFEVTAQYTCGQPDPLAYAEYYHFRDYATSNVMLIHVKGQSNNGLTNNAVILTCTTFFTGNKLGFQANDTAILNIWTNAGWPIFTTGVWNYQNYTTTLTLDASSTAELNWNTYNITTYVDTHTSVSPSNVTVGHGGSQTLSFSASQGHSFDVVVDGISQGQISNYIFSNVTAPHTVNVTSTQLFTIIASAGGNGSITPSGSLIVGSGMTQQFNFTANTGYHVSKVLVDNASRGSLQLYTFNNVQANHTITVSFAINVFTITALVDAHSAIAPRNVSINYGENQIFNITADSGYRIRSVYVDGKDMSNISSYNFVNAQSNHTISTSSTSLDQTTSPTPSTDPNITPSKIPSTTQNNQLPTETIAIIISIIVTIAATLAVALKKGYMTIEIIDENPSEENPEPQHTNPQEGQTGKGRRNTKKEN